MMDGFSKLNTLKSELEESFKVIKTRTTHLMVDGCNEETQTQVYKNIYWLIFQINQNYVNK